MNTTKAILLCAAMAAGAASSLSCVQDRFRERPDLPERESPPVGPAPVAETAAVGFSEACEALHYREYGAPFAFVEVLTILFPERRVTIDCYPSQYAEEDGQASLHGDWVASEDDWLWIAGQLDKARIEEWAMEIT